MCNFFDNPLTTQELRRRSMASAKHRLQLVTGDSAQNRFRGHRTVAASTPF